MPDTLAISANLAPKINFAFQQNDVAFIREIIISNPHSEPVSNLVLELSTSPKFLNGKTWKIDRIDANAEVRIRERDVVLNGTLLMGLRSLSISMGAASDGFFCLIFLGQTQKDARRKREAQTSYMHLRSPKIHSIRTNKRCL